MGLRLMQALAVAHSWLLPEASQLVAAAAPEPCWLAPSVAAVPVRTVTVKLLSNKLQRCLSTCAR